MNKKEKSNKHIFVRSLLRFLALGMTGLFVAALGMSAFVVFSAKPVNFNDVKFNYSSFIYYIDGKTGKPVELERIYGSENRVWVDFDKIPQHVKNAAVAIEDERFYSHMGFDIKRTIGAFANMFVKLRNSNFGGSTITQQLVKNITGDSRKSITRKMQEIWRAICLERDLSKDQILELYLNTMYLSQGCNGVQAASHMYFDKDVSELNIAEAAAIIGITQYPVRYDPFINPENNKTKQELVLKKMLDLGYINLSEYDKATAYKLKFERDNMRTKESFQSYFVDQVVTDVLNDLQNIKKYSKDDAVKQLYSGGFRIYSTIDPKIQKAVEDIYYNDANFPKPKGGEQPQSAMVIIDPYTGEVKAMAGGAGKKRGNFVFNRAVQAYRQPGSCIKPISVYAPAVEYGIISPSSVYVDEPVTYGGWSPKNYYSGFRGAMTVREAVNISANIPAVKILNELGVDRSYDFLKNKLFISSVTDKKIVNKEVFSDKNLSSLGLGGLTNGVSPLEMAGAYSTFVNKGIYTTPSTYTKVVDKNGKVILEKRKQTSLAMSESTANVMTDLLRGVMTSGTGRIAALSAMPTIGKTGTTNDDKDRWFIGATPYYVGAVWFGFDSPQSMSYLSSNPSAKLWKSVMEKVHSGLSYKSFPSGAGIYTEVSICTVSGKLSTDYCIGEDGLPTVKTQSMQLNKKPDEYCDVHKAPENDNSEPDTESAPASLHPSPTPIPLRPSYGNR